MQRAYDNVIHDVALQKLKVILCLDRAGLVGEDGATHQGVFDLAAFRPVPNLVIASPLDELELRNLMYTAALPSFQGPIIIRYPRGNGEGISWRGAEFRPVPLGRGRLLHPGKDVAVLSIGPIGNRAAEAVRRVITVEDGMTAGGLHDAVASWVAERHPRIKVIGLGVPDKFVEQGTIKELRTECGYDTENIFKTICNYF